MALQFLGSDFALDAFRSYVSNPTGSKYLLPGMANWRGTARVSVDKTLTDYKGLNTQQYRIKVYDYRKEGDSALAIQAIPGKPIPTGVASDAGTLTVKTFTDYVKPDELTFTYSATTPDGVAGRCFNVLNAAGQKGCLIIPSGLVYNLWMKFVISEAQLTNFQLIGVGADSTCGATIYTRITYSAPDYLIEVFSDAARTLKIMAGTTTSATATILLEEANDSGLYAYVDFSYTGDADSSIAVSHKIQCQAVDGASSFNAGDVFTVPFVQCQIKISTDQGVTYGSAVTVADAAPTDYTVSLGYQGAYIKFTLSGMVRTYQYFVIDDYFDVLFSYQYGELALQMQNRTDYVKTASFGGNALYLYRIIDAGQGETFSPDTVAILDIKTLVELDRVTVNLFAVTTDTDAKRSFGTVASFPIGDVYMKITPEAALADDCHNGDSVLFLSGEAMGTLIAIVDTTSGSPDQYELASNPQTAGAAVGDNYVIVPIANYDQKITGANFIDSGLSEDRFAGVFECEAARLWFVALNYNPIGTPQTTLAASQIRLGTRFIPTSNTGRMESHNYGASEKITAAIQSDQRGDGYPLRFQRGKRGYARAFVMTSIADEAADQIVDFDAEMRNENTARAVMIWPNHAVLDEFELYWIEDITIQKMNALWSNVTLQVTRHEND